MQSISSKNIYPFNCKRGVKPLNLYKVQPAPKEKRKAKRGLSVEGLLIVLGPLAHPYRRYALKRILENKVPPPAATPAPKEKTKPLRLKQLPPPKTFSHPLQNSATTSQILPLRSKNLKFFKDILRYAPKLFKKFKNLHSATEIERPPLRSSAPSFSIFGGSVVSGSRFFVFSLVAPLLQAPGPLFSKILFRPPHL